MAYTIIPPFAPGTHDEPTITEMNQILNNITYNLGGYQKNFTQYNSTITSTSTSFAALSTTNARITLTTNSGRIFGFFTFNFLLSFSSSGAATAYFDVLWNSTTRIGDATLGLVESTSQALAVPITVPFLIEGLTVGQSYTIDLVGKLVTSSGTGYQINVSRLIKFAWE